MTNIVRNEKKGLVKYFAFFLIIFCFLVPILSVYLGNYFIYEQNGLNDDQAIPKAHSITKDNYSPILSEEKHGLGNITVVNLTVDSTFGLGFTNIGGYKAEYNLLADDVQDGALNFSFKEMKLISTIRPAIVDNLNENITDNANITIKLNESVSVQYNISKEVGGGAGQVEGFLIYGPRLFPCISKELYIQNGSIIDKIEDDNYTIDEGINFLRFNYKDYFGGSVQSKNFTMYIIWEYSFTIINWRLSQYPDQGPDYELLILNQQQQITPKFNYRFTLDAIKYNGTFTEPIAYPFVEIQIPAFDVNFQLKVNLPDKDLLTRTALIIDGLTKNVDAFNNTDNSMNVGNDFKGNSSFSLDFQCSFIVNFESAVHYTWAIDRLVSDRNIRERVYLPTISSGPTYIYLKYVRIFESTISIDQVVSNTSLFERNLMYFDANVSEFEAPTQNSLIFTVNATKKKGLEIILPYMIKGEISPFIFKYTATRNLRIKITDSINMPLVNCKIEIYYYGIIYGTYISIDRVQPSAPTITDQNGEVLITDVPNGNYTLIVYQNDIAVLETSVSAFREVNYVVTDIPHFPLTIIIFCIFSSICILLGFVIYKKNKR